MIPSISTQYSLFRFPKLTVIVHNKCSLWRFNRRGYSSALHYVRKSPVEHILLRPETYIGPIHLAEHNIWRYDFSSRLMKIAPCTFPPGLLKIFDEILVNAADNQQRDPKMTTIRIEVDRRNDTITVWNNGRSLPIEIHPKEGLYVATLVFGHLFTSSNYDDSHLRMVGGRNGFGAKLCNVFSTKFTIETGEKQSGRTFRQTWTDNMETVSEAEVSEGHADDFTKITFQPDLKKFGMAKLTDGVVDLFYRRAVDVAGTLDGVAVYFDGALIEVEGFQKYISLFTEDFLFLNLSRRWKIGIASSLGGFAQISFVNNISTLKGGKHVDMVVGRVVDCLRKRLEKMLGGRKTVKPSVIKSHLFLFINCLIENPTFESQTKETLCTPINNFNTTFHLNEESILEWAEASGLLSTILEEIQSKKPSTYSRHSKKIQEVTKLEDATLAGTTKSARCSLLVTEGDSAKAFAVSGLEVIGRERFGVFPIRGKLINVTDVDKKKITTNAEIKNLMTILGLKFGENYALDENFRTLRYGSVILLADQDEDGSHIKGLLLNFFHCFWPALLTRQYISAFKTPLIKAAGPSGSFSFFTTREFNEWRKSTPDTTVFDVKYYKGLGTSTSAEAREYFKNIDKHLVTFTFDSEEDSKQLQMAFNRSGADRRKTWIQERIDTQGEEKSDGRTKAVRRFIDEDLITYSMLDLRRSIPSAIDGLKPSQRKVLHCLLQQKQKKEIKVNQLAGAVSMSQGYHHGEESLVETIVKMAQDFLGSNNVNLLQPIGQFGTRHEGGSDAARGRYIYTALSPLVRALFPKVDDSLLTRLSEDGQLVEPVWYCPVVPLVLINGSMGIATGWATTIYPHRPSAVIDAVRRLIEDQEPARLDPWYRGFQGTVNKVAENSYSMTGLCSVIGKSSKVEVTELPVGVWTNKYKQNVLLPLIEQGHIGSLKEHHTEKSVRFELDVKRKATFNTESLRNLLRLRTSFSSNSMNLFDASGTLRHYNSDASILREHYAIRRSLYKRRIAHQASILEKELIHTQNQLRFVQSVVKRDILLFSRSKEQLEAELQRMGFLSDPLSPITSKTPNYFYLLGMPLFRLTTDEIDRLEQKSASQKEQLAAIQNSSWQDVWIRDLDTLTRDLKTYGML